MLSSGSFTWPLHAVRFLMAVVAVGFFVTGSQAATMTGEERELLSESLVPLPAKAAATVRAPSAHHFLQPMEFSVPLRMRDYPSLLDRLTQGGRIPAAEMDRRFLPLKTDYAAVVQWLKSEGFTITRTDPSRLAVFARGTVGQIQKSLQVEMAEVIVDGRDYHTARSHPSIPKRIAAPVLGINGLQPFLKASRHQGRMIPQIADAPPFLTSEILGAYNANGIGVTGSGQKIAILIDMIAANSDLTAFWARNGVPQSLGNIEIVNVTGATLGTTEAEAAIDEEWTSGIAPGAKVRVYATGALDFLTLDKGLQQIISDLPTQSQLHQLSISLGLGEGYLSLSQMQTDRNYMATIASYGVSVFVASGDGGSNPNSAGASGGATPMVEYYASDPSVTGVGGTSLTLNQNGAVTAESAWIGSGGGVSGSPISFGRPSWQVGTGVPSGTTRCVPDVAVAASPQTGYYVYLSGSTWQYGGTSLGAPVWAGFCAMINEARAKVSLGSMGLLNSRIYPLLGTTNFRDIASGSNGVYSAGAGYDCVTGLGVPNVAILMQTLLLPEVSGLQPASGGDGTVVTISGFDLTGATAVTFNGVNAQWFTVNSSNQITAAAPIGVATGPIAVTSPLGTGTGTGVFTFVVPSSPIVNVISPASAVIGGSVTVSGSNFAGISAVKFNGTNASFTVGANVIFATVPAGVTTGPISVVNMTGTGVSSTSFVPAAGLISGTLYSTAFEYAEGYSIGSLQNQNGWLGSGSGGNGIRSVISGQGQQGYVGRTAPTSGTVVTVWQPINHTPAVNEIVSFSVLLEIVNSTIAHPNYDHFRWTMHNLAGASLFSIELNNQSHAISYLLDDGSSHDTGLSFANSAAFPLQVTIDFRQNLWSATLSGSTLANNQPVTTTGAALNLGDIAAVWLLQSSSYGNNYMAFDNYTISTSVPTYAVSTSAAPVLGGSTSGDGIYASGSSDIVTAAASSGYIFVNWTEGGAVVSTSASYGFTVTGPHSLLANFQAATFAAWAANHFTPSELTDSTVSGPLADPDNDGVPNLLEYAFNSDPKAPDASIGPQVTLEGGCLTLTYVQNRFAGDLIFVVEVSSDLIVWNSGDGFTTTPVVTGTDASTQTVKVSDLTSTSASARRFIRLRVVGQ